MAQQPQAEGGAPFYIQFMPIVLLGLMAYFMLLRPAQRAEQQRRATVAGLKKNDRIVNSGGIIGIVDSIRDKEDEVVLKGGVHILKSSVVRVLGPDEAVKESQAS